MNRNSRYESQNEQAAKAGLPRNNKCYEERLQQLQLRMQAEAQAGAKKLGHNEQWKHRSIGYRHASKLWDMMDLKNIP